MTPRILALTALLCAPALASAQPADGQAPPADDQAPPATDQAPPAGAASQAELVRRLEAALTELRDDNAELRDQLAYHEDRITDLAPLSERITGYIDIGFFAVQGDGSGIRPDFGNRVAPEYQDVVPGSWVFLGDVLATAINSRGEPADTGGSRDHDSDTVNAGGNPSFLVNTVSASLFRGVGPSLAVEATLDVTPRALDRGSMDQLFHIPRAYVEYIAPLQAIELHLYAGKLDSVIGIEYRAHEAPQRIAVTPSLVCRYTCGQSLGIKARALLLDGALIAAAAVTNGSFTTEQFSFRDEIDRNRMKTVTGRVSYRVAVGEGIELGASGAIGPQDGQPRDSVLYWHVGADLSLAWRNILVAAEYVKGEADGDSDELPCDLTPCIDYQGAYGQIGYRLRGGLIPYARVDWRDATLLRGGDFAYVTDIARLTVGARKELGTRAIAKLEYTHTRELGTTPQAANDVLTSSLIVTY